MKNILYSFLAAVFAACSACSDDAKKDKAVLSCETSSEIAGEGATVTLTIESNGTWVLESTESFATLETNNGKGDSRVNVVFAMNTSASSRKCKFNLKSGVAASTLELTQQGYTPTETPTDTPTETPTDTPTDTPASENTNANTVKGYKVANTLAIPALNSNNTYAEHFVTDAADTAVFNYAVEWDSEKKGANWVAFEFNSITRQSKGISRSNSWAWDTEISSNEQVINSMHSYNGYDKGHICAAMDRDYSTQAKDQTFLYSNCFAQIGVNFNQGYWNDLEDFFRGWCRSKKYDHVYVTKGGTLNDLLTSYKGEIKQKDTNVYPETDAKGYTEKGLPVPRYFYMAILTQSGDQYKAMAFYVEHKEYDATIKYGSSSFKKNAISIDELEEKTGIDFFCNLPDEIENEVEANYSESEWDW